MKNIVVLIAAITLTGSPAIANWQYTQWGMTSEQVRAVIKGNGASTIQTDAWQADKSEFSIRLKVADIPAIASFRFDPDKLSSVMVFPEDQGDCGKLLSGLLARYGAADSRDEGRTFQRIRWRDAAAGNSILFVRDSSIGCRAEYAPALTEKSGL